MQVCLIFCIHKFVPFRSFHVRLAFHTQMYDFHIAYMEYISHVIYLVDAKITNELHINGSIITHGSCTIGVLCKGYISRPILQPSRILYRI